MKNLQLVEPFKHTYFVLDRITMGSSQRYDHLYKLFDDYGSYVSYYSDGYGDKITYMDETNVRKAIICVETGIALAHLQIKEAMIGYNAKRKTYIDQKNHKRENDLIRYRRNDKKIKLDWASKLHHASFNYRGYVYDSHYSKCGNMGYHRMGRIVRELSCYENIIKEYDREYPNLVRGKRRSIPANWSREKGISAYHSADSWKHHSKRRKQWIPK